MSQINHPKILIFPEPFIQLFREAEHHPKLVQYLSKYPPGLESRLEEKIAEISAYCGIILDGVYTQPELEKLADILYNKLKRKRTLVIAC